MAAAEDEEEEEEEHRDEFTPSPSSSALLAGGLMELQQEEAPAPSAKGHLDIREIHTAPFLVISFLPPPTPPKPLPLLETRRFTQTQQKKLLEETRLDHRMARDLPKEWEEFFLQVKKDCSCQLESVAQN